MAARILVIEDEPKIARVLELELEHEGYDVEVALNGIDGLRRACEEVWDLILLDILLPGKNGVEVLKGIRERNAFVPVILLTALDATEDIVTGLDLGANDYVTKPFSYEELSARIRGLLRLMSQVKEENEEEVYQVDDLTMDTKRRVVVRDGNQVELTPREFDLLLYFIKHNGEVRTREQILSDVWGYDFAGDTNLVDVYIRYLRLKIDKGFRNKLIHTQRGIGYYLRVTDA